MIVGVMREYKNPDHMVKLIALIGKAKGIEIVFIHPSEVDIENNRVSGRILVDDRWFRTSMRVPKVIDISAFCMKYTEVVKFLRRKAILTENGKKRLTKEKLQKELKRDEDFEKHLIPTINLEFISPLTGFLSLYGKVVVKPVYSQRGTGVYIIEKINDDEYIIGHKRESHKVNLNGLRNFFDDKIKGVKHIVQQYIECRTPQGDPFDCRIHLEKNGKGNWVIPKSYIRIGIGQKIVSNVNDGGGVADPEKFLHACYGEIAEPLIQRMRDFAFGVAKKIEEIRMQELMTIGLDIGIDNNLNFYLFEANSAPATREMKSEVAMLRTDYYKFLYNKASRIRRNPVQEVK
ncbi:YheC/YheD family protein [Oceanobacillus sp. ISL-74]|uniref:YheC/YheD family protein n=2 Tax=unclassified Oceanobacillus TaxID=2630292 RepID=UPI001BE52876|nr:YheC/YheD family protein [Oceanobacillus sp. ISL-74]MBT2601442.1 YheC/YheD family protein [Oceanobacillus sp. ISL-74]